MRLGLGLGLTRPLGDDSLASQVAALFAATLGPAKLWLDPSDPATRFQDQAGTTLVTADGQPYGRANDKSGGGNNVGQVTTTSRPLWRTDGVLSWAASDGVDDGWQSLVNFDASGASKLTLIAGIRKRSDAAAGILAELGPVYGNPGAFGVFAPSSGSSSDYLSGLTGATATIFAGISVAAPDTCVLTVGMDLAAASGAAALYIQRNNSAPSTAPTAPGSRNFLSAMLNLLRRNNTSTPTAVDLFGMMILPGTVGAADLAIFKAYIAQKSGVTL